MSNTKNKNYKPPEYYSQISTTSNWNNYNFNTYTYNINNNYNLNYKYSYNYNPGKYELVPDYYNYNSYYEYQYFNDNLLLGNNKTTIFNYKGSHFENAVASKLTRDIVNNLIDGRNKVEFGLKYVDEMGRSLFHTYGWKGLMIGGTKFLGKTYSRVATVVKDASDYSYCSINEINYLKDNGYYNWQNVKLAQLNCGYNTFNNTTSLSLVTNMANVTLDTVRDKVLVEAYKYNATQQMSTFDNFKLYLFDHNITPIYNSAGSVSKPINYVLDYVYDAAKDGLSFMVKYHMARMKDLQDGATGLYNIVFNNDTNVNSFEYDEMLTYDYNPNTESNSTEVSLSYFDITNNNTINNDTLNTDSLNTERDYYDYSYEEYNDNSNITDSSNHIDGSNSIDGIDDINDFIETNSSNTINTDDETTKELSKIQDREKLFKNTVVAISAATSVVDVIRFIKDFHEMSAKEKFMFIENFVISLLPCGNPFGPMFSAVTDMALNGNITVESFMDTAIAIFQSTIDVPIMNTYNLVKGLCKGEHFKEYIVPVLVDVVSMFVPPVMIINMANSLIKGICGLFSHQGIHKVDGVDCQYTDQLTLKGFKKRHRVHYRNDFFGIDVTCSKKHASDAKAFCEAEVKKQLKYKVYQVIGIPIEVFNDTYDKPVTRYQKYAFGRFMHNIQHFWYDTNLKYMNKNQKVLMYRFHFENQEDRDYRTNLLANHSTPSWYWYNRSTHIGKFTHDSAKLFKHNFNNIHSYNLLYRIYKAFVNTYHQIVDNSYSSYVDNVLDNHDPFIEYDNNYDPIFGEKQIYSKQVNNIIYNTNIMRSFKFLISHYYAKLNPMVENMVDPDHKILNHYKSPYLLAHLLLRSKTLGHIFKNSDLINGDLDVFKTTGKEVKSMEDEAQKDTFTNIKNKRTGSDNKRLDNYLDKHRLDYKNFEGDYTRSSIIKFARQQLWIRQQSAEYVFQTIGSATLGYIGFTIAYLDKDVVVFVKNPIKYPFQKLYQLSKNCAQGYITRVLVDQTVQYVSLLEFTEQWSDDFLIDYINPFIATFVGIGVGITRYLVTFDKEKPENDFKNVVANGTISTVNSSITAIYNYLKKMATASTVKKTVVPDILAALVKGINNIFKVTLSIDVVSTVLVAIGFNLFVRLISLIYKSNSNNPNALPYKQEIKPYILDNPIKPFIESHKNTTLTNDQNNNDEMKPFVSKNEINPYIVANPMSCPKTNRGIKRINQFNNLNFQNKSFSTSKFNNSSFGGSRFSNSTFGKPTYGKSTYGKSSFGYNQRIKTY